MKNLEIIDESIYQRIKKEMNKTNDYFTEEEIKYMEDFTKKIDVILT